MYMSNNELKETDIKNRTCYYFKDITDISNVGSSNILLNEKSYKNFFMMLHTKLYMVQSLYIFTRYYQPNHN